MTNSPPSKVDRIPTCPSSILASGVDSLVLTIDVIWKDDSFFKYLASMKAIAKQEEKDVAITIGSREGREPLLLSIKPFGTKGHEWILQGDDYALTIGDWLEPKSRPGINATIRSETLWALGPEIAVTILLDLLTSSGARIQRVKPSRVDLCVDYLMPERQWSRNLEKYMVTRAVDCSPHSRHKVFSGFSLGKGSVVGRLYDKPLEISQKSKKFWMYNVWGIESVPEGYRIIRVEGQFRRAAIKELGIDSVADLFGHLDNLWAYFSKAWLKFQNNPGKHHLLRKTVPFWKTIQNGFYGVQGAHPLIRCKSLQTKKKQIAAQVYGLLNSFIAIEQEEKGAAIGQETTMGNSLARLGDYFKQDGKNEFELNIDIITKRAKHNKAKTKMLEVDKRRSTMGFPSNLPIELNTKE
ncbi:MAG: hypothetical protein KJ822_19750 [Proteobacteria bacterium]|jgi:hypothetical protein|nr:hypothetical protein [Pseudomonadota bacterium]